MKVLLFNEYLARGRYFVLPCLLFSYLFITTELVVFMLQMRKLNLIGKSLLQVKELLIYGVRIQTQFQVTQSLHFFFSLCHGASRLSSKLTRLFFFYLLELHFHFRG